MLGHIVRRSPSPATVISLFALFVALGGTAYAATGGTFILGQANTAGAASSLTSTVTSAPALTVKNTGGKPAAKFTSKTGVAPFQVSNGTKVTNLNADKLDGADATAFARGTGATVLSNRLEVASGSGDATLLALPGLGEVTVDCSEGSAFVAVNWKNTSSAPMDVWTADANEHLNPAPLAPTESRRGALYSVASAVQIGNTIIVGQGTGPARTTATATVGALRWSSSGPCTVQATATLWTPP